MNSDRFDSLDELKNVIEMGLDIEFFIDDVRYNISWENDNCVFISICPCGETKYYANTQELLNNYRINGVPIKDLWKDIRIYHV